jgi:hypothetical protein
MYYYFYKRAAHWYKRAAHWYKRSAHWYKRTAHWYKRTAHWYNTVTSVLLKPYKHRLVDVSQFRLSKSLHRRSVPFKCANNFAFVVNIVRIVEFTRSIYRHRSTFFFCNVVSFSCHIKFSFDAQNPPSRTHCCHAISLRVSSLLKE